MGLLEYERCDEAQERKGFSERESDEHVLSDDAVCLWLTSNGLDTVTEDETDTDTWTNGRKTVTNGSQVSRDAFCDDFNHLLCSFSLVRSA